LGATLAALARRHEALRTRFPAVAGRGRQEVLAPAAPPLPLLDLAGLAGAARRGEELARLLAAEARLPFDLAAAPPLRALLLRLGAGEHVLLLVLHHIVCDGWSMGVV